MVTVVAGAEVGIKKTETIGSVKTTVKLALKWICVCF